MIVVKGPDRLPQNRDGLTGQLLSDDAPNVIFPKDVLIHAITRRNPAKVPNNAIFAILGALINWQQTSAFRHQIFAFIVDERQSPHYE